MEQSAKKVNRDNESLQTNFKADYINLFKIKFKELFQSKDLPMQFSTLPSEVDFDKILDMKLMLYTDFVKPTCKVEVLRIQYQNFESSSEDDSNGPNITNRID